jgi:hypothetical protein
MWQDRRLGRGKRDGLEVARETSWTWQERRLGGGDVLKRDVLKVARATYLEVERETSWRWQERCLGGGKRDVLEVERVTLRGINSDVVSMGETLLEVARATSWRWKERHLVGGKRDVWDVERETSRTWQERR